MTAGSWSLLRLRDAGTWYGGGTPSKARAEYWRNGDVPWLSPKDMGPPVIARTQDQITRVAVAESAVRLVPSPSVAVVVRSGILERALPVAIVPFETTLNQDMRALHPRDDVDARWVAWWLRGQERHLLQACRKRGTTVASIDSKALLGRDLPLPPMEEQQRIIEILEDHLSRLASAESDLLHAARTADRLLQSARAQAWIESIRLGAWQTVGHLGHVVTGVTPRDHKARLSGEAIPFVTPGDVGYGDEVANAARSIPATASLRLLPGPSVLAVCIGATLGKVGWTKRTVTANQQINAVLVGDAHDPMFFAQIMSSPLFQRQMRTAASATTMPILNKSRFASLGLPVPPLSHQRAAVSRLEDVVDHVKRLRAEIEASRARGQSLRRALLTAAFTGRLTGRSSDSELVQELAGV